ncbi:hypothetical protein PCANC_08098 [Puccinia coronata f. sp. avenae]|uniref:Rapamycin-insensitive companion of mTOR N-terminal domain-containing protein n=1 Tax=Puccinia coronata f. sp. avenae TaxID=200324 RepID=A0A2N5V3F9_9BASI|nr:hypothetical protein PCANC_08098 [Puccinia coronata f. sp. avenae]
MADPLADSEWQSLPVHDHTTLCEVTNRSIDPGSRLFDLAFGINHESNTLGQLVGDGASEDNDDLDEDTVKIQLKIIAMGALCNLVLEFSTMKWVRSIEPKWGGEVHQAIEILPVPIAERIGSLGIEEYHLLSSNFQLKLRVIICLGWVEVYKCLNDKNLSIQENMISLLRNLVCGEISDIKILFRHLINTRADLLHQVGAGQGLKCKDNKLLSSQPNNSIAGSSTITTTSTLHTSVKAELNPVNQNVKGLLKEIKALEALSAHAPRTGRRRLKTNESSQSNPPAQSFADDAIRIQSEIEDLINKLTSEESLSESSLRKLSDLVKSQAGNTKLNRRKLIEIGLLGLTDSSSTDVRAELYRLLRHAAHTLVDINILCLSRIEFLIIKTLKRNHKSGYEKLQALILVQSVACHPCFLTLSIVRAIVSIAETAEEKLRQLSIESLEELMVRDFKLLAQADGIKVIMQSLNDTYVGLKELAPYMANLIMARVDRPACRQYLKSGIDFELALAAITKVNKPTSTQAQEESVRRPSQRSIFP